MSNEDAQTNQFLADQLAEFRWRAIEAMRLPLTTPTPELLDLIISSLERQHSQSRCSDTPRAYAPV